MENERNSNKLSLITEFILFLVIVLITFLLINKTFSDVNVSEESLSSKLIEGNNIEYQNNEYVKNIKKKYGINIVYGTDSEKFASKFSSTVQEDENIINNNLKIIEKSLSKYPIEAFNMCKTKKYPLNIIIVDKFLTNDIALASKNALNEFTIYISNNENFERAFHHEMYHIFEYYILDTRKSAYLSFKNLNPDGFSYTNDSENITDEYVYNPKIKNIEQNDAFFVTKYSKFSEKEDRAEIFAEVMSSNVKPEFLTYSKAIYDKLIFIDNILKENITDSKFYYSKYIK